MSLKRQENPVVLELEEPASLNIPDLQTDNKLYLLASVKCKNKAKRAVTYFKSKRRFFKNCISSLIKCSNDGDPRPYATITINSKTITGLLDSGATVSVLGRGAIALLEELGVKYKKVQSNITTADGTKNTIEGYVWLPVVFGNQTENIQFCIVPNLKSPVYLGIDFWQNLTLFRKLCLLQSAMNKSTNYLRSLKQFPLINTN